MWKYAILAIFIIAYFNQSTPIGDISNEINSNNSQTLQTLHCPVMSQQDPVKRQRFTDEAGLFQLDCLPTMLALVKDYSFEDSLATNSVNLVLSGNASFEVLTCVYQAHELETLCPNYIGNLF